MDEDLEASRRFGTSYRSRLPAAAWSGLGSLTTIRGVARALDKPRVSVNIQILTVTGLPGFLGTCHVASQRSGTIQRAARLGEQVLAGSSSLLPAADVVQEVDETGEVCSLI
ncbi:MAG: hypothetical protein ACLQER_15845, partial [Streptosporangiaceae bacterium]